MGIGIILGLATLAAQPSAIQPMVSQVSLVKSAEVAVPGKPFTVGIVITPEEGWYGYWTNPGDSGIPTTAKWTMPAGWSASPMASPLPKVKVDMTGTTLALEGPTMHLVEVTPPANAKGSAKIQLGLQYMVCSEACVMQSANLSFDIKLGPQAKISGEKQAKLDAARKLLPLTIKGGEAKKSGKTWIIQPPTLPGNATLEGAQFYAAEATVANHVADLQKGANGWELPVSSYMSETPKVLSGVIKLANGAAYQVALKVTAAS